MLDRLTLTILTADKKFYQGDVKRINITNKEGILEIPPNHIPLTTVIPSVTRFRTLRERNTGIYLSRYYTVKRPGRLAL